MGFYFDEYENDKKQKSEYILSPKGAFRQESI